MMPYFAAEFFSWGILTVIDLKPSRGLVRGGDERPEGIRTAELHRDADAQVRGGGHNTRWAKHFNICSSAGC